MDIEQIHIASQPLRFKILYTLTKNEKVYATSFAREFNMERKIIGFHLNSLEKAGLVKSEYGLSYEYRVAAVRYYEITKRGKEIVKSLSSSIAKNSQSPLFS